MHPTMVLGCMHALLLATANTELDVNGHAALTAMTALLLAELKGHTAIATLLQHHASCLSLGLGVALCAVLPLTWSWVVL